jgi:hypothetical protein
MMRLLARKTKVAVSRKTTAVVGELFAFAALGAIAVDLPRLAELAAGTLVSRSMALEVHRRNITGAAR